MQADYKTAIERNAASRRLEIIEYYALSPLEVSGDDISRGCILNK